MTHLTEYLRSARGLTLVEVVMVIVLLGIIGTGILLYLAGLGGGANATLTTQAAMLASSKAEEITAEARAGNFSSIIDEAPAPLAAPFDGFTREVEAFCVSESDLDAAAGTMPQCDDSDIDAKRVKVTVTWPGGAVDLVTVISDR